MVTPPDETTADAYPVIATLRAERDAALAREAALVRALDTRTAELDQRNNEYCERIDHQAVTVDVLKAMSASKRAGRARDCRYRRNHLSADLSAHLRGPGNL